MARIIKVKLGVPKLGIVEEIYNFDDEGDQKALDLNVEHGYMVLSMETVDVQSETSEQNFDD